VKFRRRTPPGYPVRPDYEGRAGPPGADPSIGARVELGPRGGARTADIPTPEEIRAFSEHFSMPWHEFQPRWAQRVHYSTLVTIALGAGAGSNLLAVEPADPTGTLVIREVRLRLDQNLVGGVDPRTLIQLLRLQVGLSPVLGTTLPTRSVGRIPYRYLAAAPGSDFAGGLRVEYIQLSQFQAYFNTNSAGGAACTLISVVPLMVIGNRGEPIAIEINKDASAGTMPGLGLFVTGWELLIPDEYARAAL